MIARAKFLAKNSEKDEKIAQSAQAGAGDTVLIINLSWNAKNALRLNSLPGRVYIRLNEFVQRKGGGGVLVESLSATASNWYWSLTLRGSELHEFA